MEASEWRARERSMDRSTRVGAFASTRNENRQPDRENCREIRPTCHPMAVLKCDVRFLGLAAGNNYEKGGTCGRRRQDYAENTKRGREGGDRRYPRMVPSLVCLRVLERGCCADPFNKTSLSEFFNFPIALNIGGKQFPPPLNPYSATQNLCKTQMAQILVSLIFLNLWSKLQTLPEDGFADMRGEYEESEGQQVLRHLKA